MKEIIRVGSRDSALAVAQSMLLVDYLRAVLPETRVELVTMKTAGDRVLDRTLEQIGGKGLFVRELDQALRDGRVDLTVHSLKDVPMELPGDLPLLCVSRREDPRDVLVLPEGQAELTPGAPIGTSSPRREVQLKALYPDDPIRPVRGNLQTRLKKLDEGQYGALALAAAGLKRLGLGERVHRYFRVDELIPAAGQGILCVQGRRGEDASFLAGFASREAWLAAVCERAFVTELNGGCSSPVCAHAVVDGGGILLRGLYWDGSTGETRTGTARGGVEEAERLGRRLARQLRDGEEAAI